MDHLFGSKLVFLIVSSSHIINFHFHTAVVFPHGKMKLCSCFLHFNVDLLLRENITEKLENDIERDRTFSHFKILGHYHMFLTY